MRVIEIIIAVDVNDDSGVDVEALKDELEAMASGYPGVINTNAELYKDEEYG